MICCSLARDSIMIDGHALSAPFGQDLVCAAVSAVLFSGITCFKKSDVTVITDEKLGRLVLTIKENALSERNLTILWVIKKQIRAIARNYPRYVRILRV